MEQAALIDGCSILGVLAARHRAADRAGHRRDGDPGVHRVLEQFPVRAGAVERSTKTLPVAVLGYIGYNSIQWGTLMAAATLITLPVLVLAMCVQRYIVRGLVAGAVNG